jgi:hypothetical protein
MKAHIGVGRAWYIRWNVRDLDAAEKLIRKDDEFVNAGIRAA